MAMNKDIIVEKLLRFGVAFSFIYPPISAFFNPYAWVGYFPSFFTNLIPVQELQLLQLFGIVELCIGLWILLGKRIFIPSAFAALLLSAIIICNFEQFDVLFRDVPILLAAIALCILHKKDSDGNA